MKRIDRAHRGQMGDLREGLSIEKCVIGRLVKSWVKWARHVERMVEDGLPIMAYDISRRKKGNIYLAKYTDIQRKEERQAVLEIVRLHREGHQEGRVGRLRTGGRWLGVDDCGGGPCIHRAE